MTHPRTPAAQDGEHDDLALPPLADQATFWVIRLTGGEATFEEMQEFRRWRDERPEHAAALAEARRHWLLLGLAPDVEPASPSPPDAADVRPPTSSV